ncbi:MAG: hypothetical protein HWD92_05295 [Flavobacteriia bacterium]|nr:hypothetical protein [Flavobacteriia bacterium]
MRSIFFSLIGRFAIPVLIVVTAIWSFIEAYPVFFKFESSSALWGTHNYYGSESIDYLRDVVPYVVSIGIIIRVAFYPKRYHQLANIEVDVLDIDTVSADTSHVRLRIASDILKYMLICTITSLIVTAVVEHYSGNVPYEYMLDETVGGNSEHWPNNLILVGLHTFLSASVVFLYPLVFKVLNRRIGKKNTARLGAASVLIIAAHPIAWTLEWLFWVF